MMYSSSHSDYEDMQKTWSSWREILEEVGCSQEEGMTAGFLTFNCAHLEL